MSALLNGNTPGGTVAAAALGAAGTRLRSDGTDPVWADPDVVCTYAELATTYAPSAVLRGVVALTTDTGQIWLCVRTATSAYAWHFLRLWRRPVDGSTAYCWRGDDAVGASTLAEASGGVALTPIGSPVWFPGYAGPLYGRRDGVLFEGPTGASAARFEAAITMPSGDFTLEIDLAIPAWHNVVNGTSQTDILSLYNATDYAFIRWSWSGTSGVVAGLKPTGKSEYRTPAYSVANLINTGRHHLMVSFTTTTGTVDLRVDGHVVGTVTSAGNIGGLTGSAWKFAVGNPSSNRVPSMWFGEARLSDVARSQTYALQATQYLAWS